jgi:hypothetical protein
MAEDMRLRDACVFAGRPAQPDTALQMFEGGLDAPSCWRHAFRMTQTVEFADLGGREVRCVE